MDGNTMTDSPLPDESTVVSGNDAMAAKSVYDFFLLARSSRLALVLSAPWRATLPRKQWWQRLKMEAAFFLRIVLNGYAPANCFLAVFHLEKLRVDLQWARKAALQRHEKKAVKSWSQFDKEYTANQGSPIFTWSVILVCVLIHLYRMIICKDGWTVESSESDPVYKIFVSGEFGDCMHRFFTANFVHDDTDHLMTNMICMYFFGSKLEQIHGSDLVMVTFLLAGVGGAMTSAVLNWSGDLLGASAAISGLAGLIYADLLTNWDLLEADRRSNADFYTPIYNFLTFELLLTVLNNVFNENFHVNVGTQVAHSAHTGGTFFGFCTTFMYLKVKRNGNMQGRGLCWPLCPPRWHIWPPQICFIVAMGLLQSMARRIWSYGGKQPLYCPGYLKLPFSWRGFHLPVPLWSLWLLGFSSFVALWLLYCMVKRILSTQKMMAEFIVMWFVEKMDEVMTR